MNNEKIEVGDVVEVTRPLFSDALLRGKVAAVDPDGNIAVAGVINWLPVSTNPASYNVKILEKAKRKHRVGDAYQDSTPSEPSTHYLVYIGRGNWRYTDKNGHWVDSSDAQAESMIRRYDLKLTKEGPTNDEL